MQTTTTIATTLSQRNRTGEKLIGGKLSFRTEMLRKLKCNRGKADYWKTLWLHFVRPPPPSQHRIEDLMQTPYPSVCVCVWHMCEWQSLSMSAFTECLPKRPRTVVPGDVSTRSTGPPLNAPSRWAGEAEEAFGVRCNDVLVCSATLAIKYKYAIKQTTTGRAYALLQWPAVGGDIC